MANKSIPDALKSMLLPHWSGNPSGMAMLHDAATVPLRGVAGLGSAMGEYAAHPTSGRDVGSAFVDAMTNPQQVAGGYGTNKFSRLGAEMADDPLSNILLATGIPEVKAVAEAPAALRALWGATTLGTAGGVNEALKQASRGEEPNYGEMGKSAAFAGGIGGLGSLLGSALAARAAARVKPTTISANLPTPVPAKLSLEQRLDEALAKYKGEPAYQHPDNLVASDAVIPRADVGQYFLRPQARPVESQIDNTFTKTRPEFLAPEEQELLKKAIMRPTAHAEDMYFDETSPFITPVPAPKPTSIADRVSSSSRFLSPEEQAAMLSATRKPLPRPTAEKGAFLGDAELQRLLKIIGKN